MRINVTKSSMPPFHEYIAEISELWDTHWLTNMGVKHKAFEGKLKDFLGVDGLSLFCNGHMALEMCLQAFDLSGEIITTPFTFASTTHAITRNGLTPVFCDINEDDFTIDVNKIESLITKKTSAILPVHVYGNICDTEKISEIARKHNLKVIYDAAHAFGVKVGEVGVGTFGDASMFSFHATKVFNTIEGGAVCYSERQIGERLYKLKNFGITGEDTVEYVGGNAKMNEFSAAMGLCNLRHIDEEIGKRGKIHALYQELLKDIPGFRLPVIQAGIESNYAYFPVLVNESEYGVSRNGLCNKLREDDIFARKYFYPLTNSFDCYKGMFNPDGTPVALIASHQVLTLPMYADLTETDIARICNIIKELAF